jgi:SAM-dependent methyltransferase
MKNNYEKIYRRFGTNLPWCLEEVPTWFKEIFSSREIIPCKTLDIGCGVGNYANYLAEQGFRVTGVDIAQKAIEIARKRYSLTQGLDFKIADAFGLDKLGEKYDFIYEVSLLHNLSPDQRSLYIEGVKSILNENGKFMVCCFSDQDEHFHGTKSLYFSDLDNTVYPLSEKELRDLFQEHFKIKRLEKVYFGREGQRQKERWLCLMEKK